MRRVAAVAVCCLVVWLSPVVAVADDPYELLPKAPVLDGPRASLRLVLQRLEDGVAGADQTAGARFVSRQPDIVEVDADGVLHPRSDGEARIAAEIAGHTVETTVTVRNSRSTDGWSFRHDVQSVLTRAGCNMGACHGAQAGKKGFKLTLRGYDHFADHAVITRQARGRRINVSRPEESLLLRKAIGDLAHGGGARFEADSLEYRILKEWIAAGASPPAESDPVVESVELLPKQVKLAKDGTQQFLVLARYSDGRVRDVTHWAKYTSAEASVGTIDDEGRLTAAGAGETAVTVWFASRVAVATVSVPYANTISPDVYAASPRVNLIDEHVLAKLQRLNLPPAPPATDTEFLRRAYLDTLGVLPTVDEVRAFLADAAPDKRQRLIDGLFARPEFVDYWSYRWSDLLLVSTKKLKGPAAWSFYNWIRRAVETNRPWDQFARDVVTASGSTLENGAANYFVLHKDPKQVTEATTVTFLGWSINCAQCHDHPLERWTLDDYYGMANLFARVRMKDGGSDGELIVFPADSGNIRHPHRQAIPAPRPLDGVSLPVDDPGDRREHLARWLTSPENPYFARAIVNRVWANFMGRGLVEMVDDMRATNPASNEPLLDALAAEFVRQKYDLRWLMQTILQSAAYQRSAQTTAENSGDDRFYSHYLVKRMSAEMMLDAFSQTSGVPTDFPDYPKGLRALQLPDTNVALYFLSAFGRPVREFTCECERTEEPNVTQTLHLVNGKTLNDKLKAPGGVIDRWLDDGLATDELIDRVYLSTLARLPRPAEREPLLAAFAEAGAASGDAAAIRAEKRGVLEDLFWAVLTSKEFLFVH